MSQKPLLLLGFGCVARLYNWTTDDADVAEFTDNL